MRVDTAFREVIEACSAPRDGAHGTWITPAMIDAYCTLHEQGHAHSVETWIDGRLAGGLYGIALGRVFFGESMFTRVPDASKIAFVHLVRQLDCWGFGLIDCQMRTDHLASFGAREIPRTDFAARLVELLHYDRAGEDRSAAAGRFPCAWPAGCRGIDTGVGAGDRPSASGSIDA